MEYDDALYELAKDNLERSREVHRQTFGPIIEPAFEGDDEARTALTVALNHISRLETKRGMKLLRELQPRCRTNADKAAWTFFVGVGFEMSGAADKAIKWYREADGYGHRFYLPYMKLAKAAHAESEFEKAKEYYEKAIECLFEMPEDDREGLFIGSAYTNLTSCLTMLYRYGEAEEAWKKAQEFPLPPGASATAAILYAAMGDRKAVRSYIKKLKTEAPMLYDATKGFTDMIFDGTHPHFCRAGEEDEDENDG